MQASVKEDRQNWIGGSDIPIIMGISPFITRYDLLLFKAGLQENNFEGNEYTEYGNVMEEVIRNYYNKENNTTFKETKYEYRETGIRCHLDGENEDAVMEIKTTSQIHDDPEDYRVYIVQLLFYMYNVCKEKGTLIVYERPNDFKEKTPEQWVEDFNPDRIHIYNINIAECQSLVNDIKTAVSLFKADLEKIKENPLLTEEDLLPAVIKEISQQLEMVEHKLIMYKDLEREEKELKVQLYNAMEKYCIKSWETPDKSILISKIASTPDKVETVFNEEKFKEEQPVVYASYSEERIKKGKSGYVRITIRDE